VRLLRRLSYWFRHRSRADELAEELAFHEEMKRRELVATGVAPDDAVFAARRAMGSVTMQREEARSVWIASWLESVLQDASYAARTLRREPGFTLLAIVALAVSIGLNTSVFTAFNALALRTFEAPAAHRMITLYDTRCCQRGGGQPYGFALAELDYFAARARTIDGIYAWRRLEVDASSDEAASIATTAVTANYFDVLGVRMTKGRAFTADDDLADAPQAVAILSDAFWRSRVGADSAVLGETMRIADVPFTIVGVAPASFSGTQSARVDVWIPLHAARLFPPYDSWTRRVIGHAEQCCTLAAARLASDATPGQALQELTQLSRAYRAAHGDSASELRVSDFTTLASPRASAGVQLFALLFAGVAAVLLLACANLANLLLARAIRRHHEIATRLALGASRARLVRQLLTEAMVLAMLSGVMGLVLALWLPSRLLSAVQIARPAVALTPDASVLAFALALSLVTCLLFGLAPAIHATRPLRTSMKRTSLRSALLTAQVALSVVLLVGAALLVRGVQSAVDAERGFAMRDVSAISLERSRRTYDSARTVAFVSALVRQLGASADSANVALSSGIPLLNVSKNTVRLPEQNATQAKDVVTDEVSPGYLRILGIPLVVGRAFEKADAGSDVVIVNESLARMYWGENPSAAVGRTIVSGRPRRIIGVARDVRTDDVEQVYARYYEPLRPTTIPNVLVRGPAARVTGVVDAVARQFDGRMRAKVTPLTVYLEQRLAHDIALGKLASTLGSLALALATLGMLGVFAFWVQWRQRELGVRLALGAQRHQIVALVLRGSFTAIAVGVVVGSVAAALSSRFLEGHLYGLSPLDATSYIGVVLLLVVAGLIAVYVPARRATGIDPVASLRCE